MTNEGDLQGEPLRETLGTLQSVGLARRLFWRVVRYGRFWGGLTFELRRDQR